jgi:hypothetical protein
VQRTSFFFIKNSSGKIRNQDLFQTLQKNFVAVLTFFQGVVCEEILHVLLLMGIQDAGSVTQWAGVFQRSKDGVADKFGAVGNALHGFSQRSIDFESNDVLFTFHDSVIFE